jgi:parvulin-like peptidyl-prolyl isomerase
MVERIRNEFRRITTGEADGERMSQAELDAYRRQLIMLVVTVTATALILILGIGAYYQYIHLPRQSVATVNGDTISRADYWDYRRYELLNQVNQYQQFAQFMEGEQQQQYMQMAFEADQEFQNVENASIDPMTVDEMITNKILMDALDDFGLEITEEEIDERVVEFFTGMSISDRPRGVAADPTAEAWATATVEAEEEELEAEQEELDDVDLDDAEVDDAADDSEADDAASNSSDDGTDDNGVFDDEDPFGDVSDDVDDMATPEPEPTPAEEEIRLTAEANISDHEEFLLDRAGISHDEFVEMVILPSIARDKIRDHLAEQVPTRDVHVEAAHILVATQDAAQVIYAQLTEDDADFAELAEAQSTDQATAPNGGDLGWFPPGAMVPEFDEVVFNLDVGEISEPFQSEFGWHIATVTDRDDDRPISIQLLEQQRQQAFSEWLEEQRDAAEIETDYVVPEAPDAMPGQFQPPAGAPPPPQPEMDMDMQQEIQIGDPDEVDDLFDGEDPFDVDTDVDDS